MTQYINTRGSLSRHENGKVFSEAMPEDFLRLDRVEVLRNSLLRKARWAAHGLLRTVGFEFESRRSGELRIGLWRKKLGRKAQSTPRKIGRAHV